MTDRNKFEEMLELLINEDKEGAEALFHEIVVEKSRDIYQSILEDEDEEIDESDDEDLDESDDEDLDESDDEDLDESDDEDLDESDDEDLDEMFGLDEFEVEADPMDMGGDATDDMMGDIEMPMGDEEGEEGEGAVEDRVEDLEDALEALKAEFDALMSDEEGEDHGDMDMDMGDEEGEEDEGDDEEGEEEPEESFQFESDDEEVEETKVAKSAGEQMREYVEKVAPAKMGDNGTNAKSTVAGKNDMGGTTANIAKAGTEAGVEANKGQLKGNGLLKGAAKEDNAGNVNVPGAKGATKMASRPGHGAEKKGKPETADKSASSMLNGAPKRAK